MNKEYLRDFSKEQVYDIYDAIVYENKKLYDNITKNKMVEAISLVYQNYHNIISICTLKELMFLKKMVAKDNFSFNETVDTDFIIENLEKKLLITNVNGNPNLMDGLEEPIKMAVENMNIKEIKRQEEYMIPLLGLVKVMGIEQLANIIFIVKKIYNIDNELDEYLSHSLLFNYYCFITNIPNYKYVVIYRPYLDFFEELNSFYQEKEFGINRFDEKALINIFYYDYDKKDKVVSRLMRKLTNSFSRRAVNLVALFDSDRKELKYLLAPRLTNDEVDTLINRIPSSKYKGLSKEEYAASILKNRKIEMEMTYNYEKQNNLACLSKKDADLFYKTYFAVLEYTNNYYHIKKLKIYKQNSINPYDLIEIIDKFCDNKDLIVTKFIKENPYKFNKDELDIVSNYRKVIRGLFILIRYEKEYSIFVNQDKAYMVKGLNAPIDEVIYYNNLPYPSFTTLLPFKDKIVYDGLLSSYSESITMSSTIKNNIIKEAKDLERVYHL